MYFEKVLLDPSDKMVLEHPFDDLMEEVQGKEFMYIGMGKIGREGL